MHDLNSSIYSSTVAVTALTFFFNTTNQLARVSIYLPSSCWRNTSPPPPTLPDIRRVSYVMTPSMQVILRSNYSTVTFLSKPCAYDYVCQAAKMNTVPGVSPMSTSAFARVAAISNKIIHSFFVILKTAKLQTLQRATRPGRPTACSAHQKTNARVYSFIIF